MRRPRSIILFERLFLLGIGIGVAQAALGWSELARRGSETSMLTMVGLSLFIIAALVLLVSRGRSRSAKWVLIITLLLGLPLYVASLLQGTIIGWLWLSVIQAAAQVAGIRMLFTASAKSWLADPQWQQDRS